MDPSPSTLRTRSKSGQDGSGYPLFLIRDASHYLREK